MNTAKELDGLLLRLKKGFPSLTARHDFKRRPHAEWIDVRLHLPRLRSEELVQVLPFVLQDLALTAEGSKYENGDLVIYFLDVLAEPYDPHDQATRELIEKFSDEMVGGEALENLKANMLRDLSGREHLSKDEKRVMERREREASFENLTALQEAAVYLWLSYMEPFYRKFRRVHFALLSALAYWKIRSERMGEADVNG